MGYVIAENYSVRNNYTYSNKNFISSTLDWFSTPCRRVLGGRNVDVLAQTHEHKMSTALKVVTVFFSVIIFPIAIISTAAFALKIATLPWFWEKKKIYAESKKTWEAIDKFTANFNSGNYSEAMKSLNEHKEIGKRSDINQSIFKIINTKINNHTPWSEVQRDLLHLSNIDATTLIDHAIKTRLDKEVQDGNYEMAFNDINKLINNSLRYRSADAIQNCACKILSGSLKVNSGDDLLKNTIKLELADRLISSITQLAIASSVDDLQRTSANLKEVTMRHKFLDLSTQRSLYLLFNCKGAMNDIHRCLDVLRLTCQQGKLLINTIEETNIRPNITFETRWKGYQSAISKYRNFTLQMNTSSKEFERKYFQKLQVQLNAWIQFSSTFYRKNATKEELEKSANEIQDSHLTLTEFMKDLTEEMKPKFFSSDKENLTSLLIAKKIQVAIDTYGKMYLSLFKSLGKDLKNAS